MLMTIAPGMLLTIVSVIFNTIIIVLAATGAMSTGVMIASSISSIFFCLFNYVMFMFLFGVLTTFVEWDSIHAPTRKKVLYMFTFPFFMLTYAHRLVALVKKQWKPISTASWSTSRSSRKPSRASPRRSKRRQLSSQNVSFGRGSPGALCFFWMREKKHIPSPIVKNSLQFALFHRSLFQFILFTPSPSKSMKSWGQIWVTGFGVG